MTIEELKLRAIAGDAEAQFELGCLYYKGNETLRRNYKLAFEWCLVAAEQGYAPAQSLVAEMYYWGKKIGKDLKKALFWAEKAAEQNDIKGLRVLADLYYSGPYADMDKYKECMEKAYCLGDDASKYNLGIYHLWHDDVEKGKALLEELAIQSNEDAVYQLALYYLENKNGDKAEEWLAKVDWSCGECFEIGREYFYHEEFDKADVWFERAVAIDKDHIGFIVALCKYGHSIKALPPERLFYWMKKAAEQGDPECQYELGKAYDCGKGVEPDLEESVKWYRLAAEQGHKYAKKTVLEVERRIEKEKKENAKYSKQYLDSCIKSYNAGDKEMWNEIVNYYLHYDDNDKENVFLWSKRAAEEGCVSAYCTLGWAYRNKGDTENAAFWFEKTLESDVEAAEYAKFNLIFHYADIRPQRAIELYESYDGCKAYEIDGSSLRSFGDRLTKIGNYELAFYWYSKAVEKGNRIAKDKIAEFYEKGFYVEKDVNKAIEMYKENDTFISRFALERLNVK